MDEQRFWLALEFRLCREFRGLPVRRLQFVWCDGLVPSAYVLDGPSPRITGRCWIVDGQKQAEWEFAFLLPGPVESREAIDWATLLPPENVTGWLSLDEDRLSIEIDPGAAVPDAR